ncbi:helix-turn-helix transcriptional regulator [Streptomyces antimycoticus]|uniref:helix-turn-helix transcriptional regulator n=1 Tax=Streptomyces antimycoticus TaxID=68175 RepID=UPI0025700898|nr:helix-turn-helix transcriptional regulator [Streptomyces antimycoticus]WJD99734.1 helix-turn-helix transcriptional regulator [Streptomyces antimycoticus]
MIDVTKKHVLRLAQVRAALVSGEARQLRVAAHLSVSEVASECGVDQSTIWRWENGVRTPRGKTALIYGEIIQSLRKQAAPAAKRESA